MESLWQQTAPTIASDEFPDADHVDLAVIGAGIAGLVTALLFARAGRRVVAIEARRIGAGTTGRTTAKVSRLQGAHSDFVRSRNIAAVARAYADSQAAGFDWLLDFCASAGVEVERRDAYSYATTRDGRARVEAERRAARAVGIPVELVDRVDLPFETTGAVRLRDQAQLDPMRLLAALVAAVREAGGLVVEGVRVRAVHAASPVEVLTSAGTLDADKVVLATNIPILDRGLYWAKTSAQRSYAQAWRVPAEQLPDGMFLDVEQPSRSIRTSGPLLLTGGFGHAVGREPSPRRSAEELTAWTLRHWPGAEPVASWSAQDRMTPHGIPFVGWLPRGRGRVYLATGFDKWGMTNGVATALTLASDILGEEGGWTPTDWQRILHRRPTLPQTFAAGIGENAAVASSYLRGWLGALARPKGAAPLEGMGEVGRVGVRPVAVSTVNGTTRELCAICPHLGAIVTWNDFEGSWDCPAHGSRFAPDGTVLEGPAVRPLKDLGPQA
ncbi:FAD-dependent oxidoreductase [Pseudolysinimonas sp.]|uniref:FAD-dependent oxidoreductase n=1 Tax=Pseudolysinimonas sp. TaxID=2680009 RepID=UPI003F815A39